MDKNLQNKHISSIFHRPYFTHYDFWGVLKNKTLVWIIQLSFFQIMKYIDVIYDWISTISSDMENIVMMLWNWIN